MRAPVSVGGMCVLVRCARSSHIHFIARISRLGVGGGVLDVCERPVQYSRTYAPELAVHARPRVGPTIRLSVLRLFSLNESSEPRLGPPLLLAAQAEKCAQRRNPERPAVVCNSRGTPHANDRPKELD